MGFKKMIPVKRGVHNKHLIRGECLLSIDHAKSSCVSPCCGQYSVCIYNVFPQDKLVDLLGYELLLQETV